MTYRQLIAGMIGGAVAVLSVRALAQEKKEQPAIKPAPAAETKKADPGGPAKTGPARKPEPTPEQFESERQKYEKLAAPGEHHKVLQDLMGKWSLVVRYRMGRDTDWVQTTGKSEFRNLHEGRFIQEETTTDMTGLFGKPFNWFGLHGYNNTTGKHTVVFADNMGTAYEIMEGSCDAPGRTINYTGQAEGAGGGKANIRWVMKVEGKDKFSVQMFEPDDDGKDFNNMEITGTR